MKDRYDFSKGVRGKYAGRVRSAVFHIIEEEGENMAEPSNADLLQKHSVGVTITDDDQVRLIIPDPANPTQDAIEFVVTPEQANKFAYALTACAAHASNRAAYKAQATQRPSDA
jgi:hypothetical protein